jgi:hypothetical protein
LCQVDLNTSIAGGTDYWENPSEDPGWPYLEAGASEQILNATLAALAQLWLYEYTLGYGELGEMVLANDQTGLFILGEGVG